MIKNFILGLLIIIPQIIMAGTSGEFLNMVVSPRQSALGQALVAVNREIDTIGINPAGLSGINSMGLSLMYNKQLFGNMYGKAAFIHPLGFGMIGINFVFLRIPFEETFNQGAKSGSNSLMDINFGLAFQRDITDNISLGLGAKFISVDLGSESASSAAADIGILYQINPKSEQGRFNVGLGVRNIGTSLKFKEVSESLPMTIMAGVMYQPISLITIMGQVDKPKDLDLEYGAGLEFDIFRILKPRIGYHIGNDNVNYISAGLGISREFGSTIFAIDYAMGMEVETTHQIGLKILRPALFEVAASKQIPYDGKNPSRIAVSKLETKGTKKDEAKLGETIAEWLRTDWAASKALKVVARENMDKILKEQELQITGITSPQDAVHVGEILNVQYLIFGSVNKVGSEYYINLKVVDVENGEIVTAAEEVAPNQSSLRLTVRKLSMKLDPEKNRDGSGF